MLDTSYKPFKAFLQTYGLHVLMTDELTVDGFGVEDLGLRQLDIFACTPLLRRILPFSTTSRHMHVP